MSASEEPAWLQAEPCGVDGTGPVVYVYGGDWDIVVSRADLESGTPTGDLIRSGQATMKIRRSLCILVGGLTFCVLALVLHGYIQRHRVPAAEDVSVAEGCVRILCAGDSITADSYPKRLQDRLEKAGLSAQVLNAGIPGHTSTEYLDYMTSSSILSKVNPHVVLLQLGTNDVRVDFNRVSTQQCIKNMRAIIGLVRAHRNPDGGAPMLFIATVPPIVVNGFPFTAASRRRIKREINPAIKELAKAFDLPVNDNCALFEKRPHLLPDIHPSQEGYQAMADQWFEVMVGVLGRAFFSDTAATKQAAPPVPAVCSGAVWPHRITAARSPPAPA